MMRGDQSQVFPQFDARLHCLISWRLRVRLWFTRPLRGTGALVIKRHRGVYYVLRDRAHR